MRLILNVCVIPTVASVNEWHDDLNHEHDRETACACLFSLSFMLMLECFLRQVVGWYFCSEVFPSPSLVEYDDLRSLTSCVFDLYTGYTAQDDDRPKLILTSCPLMSLLHFDTAKSSKIWIPHFISQSANRSQQKSMFSHSVWLTLRLHFWISSISGKLHLGEWAIVRHPRGPPRICRPWRERILA